MKWRVIDLETGVELSIKEDDRFIMLNDGTVYVEAWEGVLHEINVPHVVEFGFARDDENHWIWSHSVVND